MGACWLHTCSTATKRTQRTTASCSMLERVKLLAGWTHDKLGTASRRADVKPLAAGLEAEDGAVFATL